MSNDDDTTEKPTEEPKAAAAPRQRKIVRRSASTRDNPAFADAPPAPAGDVSAGGSAPASADAPAEPSAAASPAEAPAAVPASPAAPAAPAPRPRATFDARAPRPRPDPNGARPGRPQRAGDYRPPPARPIGARPIPGGPRAPAREPSGDYRPPPARPIGARPIPGGPRAPAGPEDLRPRAPRAEGGARPEPRLRVPGAPPASREGSPDRRPPRGDRPPQAAARPAAPPAPVKAPPPPARPAPKAAPKPVPVFIPLARAGQVAAASAKPAPTPKEALAAKTKAYAAKAAAKPAPKAPESARPEAGFAAELVNAGPDDAVAALVKAGDAAIALVEAWTAASNAAAIAEAAESEGAPGAARKAARRALNVLRARGVTVPVRAKVVKAEEHVELPTEVELLPPDGSGVAGFTFTRKGASGRYHIAQVLLRDPLGIVQAASGWLSGSQVKEGRTRMAESFGVAPVSVPAAWARARIAAAKLQNAASGQVLPLGFDGCRDLLEPAPEAVPPHPLAELEAQVTSESAAAAAPISLKLHVEPEFNGWLPDRGALQDLLAKVGERLGPERLGDPAAVSAALEEESAAATDRFFSPEVRAVVAGRMRDAAISIRARKGEPAAAEVLSVARAVTEAGLITSPPREIPFLVAFFQKGLSVLLREGGGKLRVPMSASGPAPAEAPPA